MNYNEVFEYDKETGDLRWKPRGREHFKRDIDHDVWNRRNAYRAAGSVLSRRDGRHQGIIVGVFRRPTMAHRIIWEMHNGPIPADIVVDHVDCDPTNNRLSNLRLATRLDNSRNSRINRTSSTGYKGAHKAGSKFTSSIRAEGRLIYLGKFSTAAEAHEAYCKAADTHHGQFARHR